MKKINLLIAFLLVSVTTPALATPSCDHPVFQVVGCTYPDDVGPAGQNGQDGADGQDGQDGIELMASMEKTAAMELMALMALMALMDVTAKTELFPSHGSMISRGRRGTT
jgi:hypothetical protein